MVRDSGPAYFVEWPQRGPWATGWHVTSHDMSDN